MADFSAVYSVGESIAQFLRNTYPAEIRTNHAARFELAKSEDFSKAEPFTETVVSLFLYRITTDQYLHPAGSSIRRGEHPKSLPLDLHYMISVWTDNKHTEHLLMTWVMAQFHWHPVLDQSNLMQIGGWKAEDMVQISPTNMSQEDLSRIWDVMEPSYRLSTTYVARVVQIDPPRGHDFEPVVATRFRYGDPVFEEAES